MNYAFSSPLKAVQGSAIRDLTEGQFGPHNSGRTPSPRKPRTDLVYPSPTSSKLSLVSIPTKPKYTPNQRPPPQVRSSRPNDATRQNERSRKVVISRFLLVDGNVTFSVGTEVDGVIIPDAEEISVANILDHVSPAELERFENQDFFDEDERERLLPPKKPRGRPRLADKLLPSFTVTPLEEETSREQSLLPEGSTLTKKRAGRPKGSFKKKAIQLTSTELSALSETSAATRRPRGRPPRQRNLSVIVPAFNGPQPQNLESGPGTQSESDELLENPKPQYSMIAASGLGQSDTEDPTSRDQSVGLGPPSKKRRLDIDENASNDSKPNDNKANRLSMKTNRAENLSDMSPDPIADDSTALLRQFQARVYGPNQSERSNNIPRQQSKSSLTLDDSHFFTPQSSLRSSSSDSLMSTNPRLFNSPPRENMPSDPPLEDASPQHPSGNMPTKVSMSCSEKGSVISHSTHHHPGNTPPTRSTSPPKSIRRKMSLTPHFPSSMGFSNSKSTENPPKRKFQPSRPQTNRPIPSQATKTAFPQTSRPLTSLLKRRKLSSKPQNDSPSQSSRASSTSRIGFTGLPRAKDITDYFAPKATISNPPPKNKPRHSPSLQLLGPADIQTDSDSEDQLARKPPSGDSESDRESDSNSDSINSEVMIVHQSHPPARAVATATEPRSLAQLPTTTSSRNTAETDHDESSDHHSSSSDSEDHEGARVHVPLISSSDPVSSPIHQSNNPVPRRTPHPHRTAAQALNTPFEPELDNDDDDDDDDDDDEDDDDDDDDDEESDGDSDSSDSLSSEVMVIRPTLNRT